MAVSHTPIADADTAAGAPVSTTLMTALNHNLEGAFAGLASFKLIAAGLDDDAVPTKIAAQSVGAIGTRAFMVGFSPGLGAKSPGDLVNSIDIRFGGVSSTGVVYDAAVVPSGIWRCMGYMGATGASPTDGTVFLRIS